MKTVCIMSSVSRANGGIFEAERRLQQSLRTEMGIEVEVVGLRDPHTETDRGGWSPLSPRALPVTGPESFGYARGFAEALTDVDADLGYLVGLWKYPSLAALRWSDRTARPIMVAPHGMLDPWAVKNSGLKKKLAGWLFQDRQLRQAACIRALCSAEAASIRGYGLKNPICVIPNGIDLPSELTTNVRHPLFPPDRKVLLYLGRLHPKKGLANLLTAWNGLRSSGHGWVLAIAGWDQGGHEAALKRQASALGLAGNDATRSDQNPSVFFLGPQFGRDKEACYRSCDAFILPSLSEGLPMVVLEAWAYAKPVAMTTQCNLPEGFAAGAAMRLEPSVESLAKGLQELFALSDPDLHAMGEKGRALVEDRFAWRKLARQMAATYSWVLGGGPRPDCVEGA